MPKTSMIEVCLCYSDSIANHKQRNADASAMDAGAGGEGDSGGPSSSGSAGGGDPLAFISDLREYDVPYTMRCGIDLSLRVGAWFVVTPEQVSWPIAAAAASASASASFSFCDASSHPGGIVLWCVLCCTGLSVLPGGVAAGLP
jgi:DNA polymerase elongation subunit (family B)